MKTAAAVLQELAVKLGMVPDYECISQVGPHHASIFEYRCTLCDISVTASARSKKEAKQEAASSLLTQLAKAGFSVPLPWGMGVPVGAGGLGASMGSGAFGASMGVGGIGASMGGGIGELTGQNVAPDAHSYVALLKEYCEEYKLPPPEYTLIGDCGPAHLRSFTIRASVGAHSRDATALNKKSARQMAAEAIYKYLRGCLRSTQDFVEVDALNRSLDKKMGRFKEERPDMPWRPPLSQKISEYQYGLLLQFDESKRAAALEALRSTAEAGQPYEIQLACAASELGIEVQWGEMPTKDGNPLVIVELPSTSPSLMYLGNDRNDAASHMIEYLNMCLPNPASGLVSVCVEQN